MSEDGIIARGMNGCLEPSISSIIKKEEKRKRHQARSLLRRASVAASVGNMARCHRLRAQAAELVGDEVLVICEELRISFARVSTFEVDPPIKRYGFATR